MEFIAHSMAGWAFIPMLGTIIVHLAFSAAIFVDAGKQQEQGREPQLVGQLIWAIAVAIGGLVAAAIYWLIHHSTLSRK